MPPPPAALPLHSSRREQTHLESYTSFASVRWHVCPRFVDSRFVTLTSCNPTRDSSTLSHIPTKNECEDCVPHLGFSSFGFFFWRFRASNYSSSVVTVSSSFAHKSFMTSMKRTTIPPPNATPGAPSVQLPELFLGLKE